MGGAAKTIGRIGSGVFTLGGSEIARNNLSSKNVVNQALQTPGAILTGGMYNPFSTGNSNGGTSGPFSLDPNQVSADQQSILNLGNTQSQQQTDLGQKQYDQTNSFITGDQASRDASRQRLSDALIKQNQAVFQQGLPATEETLNAQHLLNGSGLGQELGRQQGNIATNIANEVGTAGARDYTTASDQRAAAMQGLLGSQSQALGTTQAGGTNALSRGLSLEDFINQANIAKSIGAQAAPQVGNGKGQTGALLSGVGSLAPIAGMAMGGPAGGAAGKAASRALNAPGNMPGF
jgi:hypothetical protein